MSSNRDTMTWGTAPTSTCMKLWEFAEPEDYKDVLVWGVGDGRNAVFLAGQGYNVTAVDVSDDAFTGLNSWIKESKVKVDCKVASSTSQDLGGPYDIVISVGMVNMIPKEKLGSVFAYIQSITRDGGMNAISGFVNKPLIRTGRDSSIESGDILSLYHPWRVHWITQSIIETEGVLNCVDRVIAEKISNASKIIPDKSNSY